MNQAHCDDYIHDLSMPICLRYFLLVKRLPAIDGVVITSMHGQPKCYADYKGKRVKLVMASRFGDVGITPDLSADNGYSERVSLNMLSNFGDSQ